MSSNNRPIPQGGTQRANLSQKYSVLGPLSGGSTKPGPLGPDSLLLTIQNFPYYPEQILDLIGFFNKYGFEIYGWCITAGNNRF